MSADPSSLGVPAETQGFLRALIEEAWRRAWRRRLAFAFIVLTGGLVGAALYLGLPGGGGPTARVPGQALRLRSLALTVPRGFNRYYYRGGFYRAGTRPPVIGVTVADYRLKPHSPLRIKGVFPPSLYKNRVALGVGLWLPLGTASPRLLRLPLSLSQPWVRRSPAAGTRRYGFFRVKKQEYEIFIWIGRKAPARDRARLLHALTSIHRAR